VRRYTSRSNFLKIEETNMANYDYDLLVLGAGPGGYVAAIRATQLGMKAAVIEKDKPGGVCLNIGCIPSKALIHQAGLMHSATELEAIGVKVDTSGLDFGKVFAFSRKAADTLSRGVAYLLKKNKIDLISGEGVFTSAHEIEVKGHGKVTGKNLLVATGCGGASGRNAGSPAASGRRGGGGSTAALVQEEGDQDLYLH
jgi:dihydrolipoamide dehydrogenase